MRRATLQAALGAALLLMALPAVTAAAPGRPPDREHGTQGVHIVIDRADAPGARCIYGGPPDQHLERIVVQPPIVFASDRTSARDHQTVGWRYEIWTATDPNAAWGLLTSSAWQDAPATDASNARFTPQRFTVPDGHSGQAFYVRIRIRWLAPNGVGIVGWSAIGVHQYYNVTPFSNYVTTDSCLGLFT